MYRLNIVIETEVPIKETADLIEFLNQTALAIVKQKSPPAVVKSSSGMTAKVFIGGIPR